jgi:hypothetical protein
VKFSTTCLRTLLPWMGIRIILIYFVILENIKNLIKLAAGEEKAITLGNTPQLCGFTNHALFVEKPGRVGYL